MSSSPMIYYFWLIFNNNNQFFDLFHLSIEKQKNRQAKIRKFRLTTTRTSRNQKGISNNEQGISNAEGRRRFAPYLNSAFGAPSFDIPCSLFDIGYSFFSFPS
jgi:hypothetical protein